MRPGEIGVQVLTSWKVLRRDEITAANVKFFEGSRAKPQERQEKRLDVFPPTAKCHVSVFLRDNVYGGISAKHI